MRPDARAPTEGSPSIVPLLGVVHGCLAAALGAEALLAAPAGRVPALGLGLLAGLTLACAAMVLGGGRRHHALNAVIVSLVGAAWLSVTGPAPAEAMAVGTLVVSAAEAWACWRSIPEGMTPNR